MRHLTNEELAACVGGLIQIREGTGSVSIEWSNSDGKLVQLAQDEQGRMLLQIGDGNGNWRSAQIADYDANNDGELNEHDIEVSIIGEMDAEAIMGEMLHELTSQYADDLANVREYFEKLEVFTEEAMNSPAGDHPGDDPNWDPINGEWRTTN